MQPRLSVVLAVYNEEGNLPRCLKSVKDIAGEIVVVDGGSTDASVKIALKFGARVISTTNPPLFHINKQKSLEAATRGWILQLDADEVVSPQLAKEIKTVVGANGAENGFWLKRKNWFLGRFLTKGGQYPDPVIRLVRRGRARFPCKSVHEQIEVDGQVGWLKNDLLHYATPTFERYLLRFNRYTSLTAEELRTQNLSINIFTAANWLLVKPLITFLTLCFRRLGIVDGFPGFIFALFSGLHHAVSFIKYWQETRFPA